MEASWRRNYLRYKSFFLNMLTQYKERSDWKAYLEILLSLLTVSIFSIFALRPTLLTIAELIKQIEEKKETVAQMDAKISSLSAAQSIYDRERNNIKLLNNFSVPQKAEYDIFARQIEGLSSRYQIGITSFSLGEAQILGRPILKPKPGTTEASKDTSASEGDMLSFSINSTLSVDQYPSVINFLRDFENLRTISQVENLDLRIKEEEKTNQKTLILLLEGAIPYFTNEPLK
jgi:hypothetical protein